MNQKPAEVYVTALRSALVKASVQDEASPLSKTIAASVSKGAGLSYHKSGWSVQRKGTNDILRRS